MPDSAQSSHPGAGQLAAFAQGKLAGAERAAVQAHLKACPACRQTLAALPGGAESVSGRDTQATAGWRTAPEATATHDPGSDVPADLADHPRYEVLQLLGQGGMGAVYKARHKKMDRLVALKVINAQLLDNPEGGRAFPARGAGGGEAGPPEHRPRLRRRPGRRHALPGHGVRRGHRPGQVRGEEGAAAGGARLPLHPPGGAGAAARPPARHGPSRHQAAQPDAGEPGRVRPAAVTVKVMDFGLARLARETASEAGLTGENALMGTADYIAPEQAEDAHKADIRADIYSLGCSLFHLLAGRPPLAGAQRHAEAGGAPDGQAAAGGPAGFGACGVADRAGEDGGEGSGPALSDAGRGGGGAGALYQEGDRGESAAGAGSACAGGRAPIGPLLRSRRAPRAAAAAQASAVGRCRS